MAGDFVPEEELNLKGFKKYFNSYTLRGRFNWVVATYGSIFAAIACYKIRAYMKPQQEADQPPESPVNKNNKSCRTNEYY